MIDTFALSPHATWRCRHSGACCSSNWPIDIDTTRRDRIAQAVRDGAIAIPVDAAPFDAPEESGDEADMPGALRAGADTPSTQATDARHRPCAGAAARNAARAAGGDVHPIILGRTAHGECVFHDSAARRCRVHGALGHEALPLACRQFPRVCLIDARGVRVSLSHYCPSAAARLFADDVPLTIVRAPESFPAGAEYDGLDARDAFPPLLRQGVLMDWDTVDALEQLGVACFAAETESPEAALDRFAAVCEALRGWRASDGPMVDRLRAIAADFPASGGARSASYEQHAALLDWSEILKRDAEVRAADPSAHDDTFSPATASEEQQPDSRNTAAERLASAYLTHVAPVWSELTRPVCRYLAARLFGSWSWYQGQGLRSLVRSLDAALSVLRIEAARQASDSGSMVNGDATVDGDTVVGGGEAPREGRLLTRNQLREAIRRTDLRLLHLASRDALAARWSAAEHDEGSARRGIPREQKGQGS